MADIFISYARADRAAADRIAARLEGRGFSVWYDRGLTAGDTVDRAIERELAAARCVLVLWSAASVASDEVLAEAREGLRRRIVTPVRIAAVEPPYRFRIVQYEDLSDWDGDPDAEAFQRALIRITALTRGRAAAAALPLGAAATGPALRIGDAPVEPIDPPPDPLGRLGPLGTGLAVALIFAALFFDRDAVLGGFWGALVGLAAFAIALFQLAERDLNPQMKALAARWLTPAGDQRGPNAAQFFLSIFEAVFSRRQFTLRCFAASTISSLILLPAVFILLAGALPEAQIFQRFPLSAQLIVVVMYIIFINVVGDYVSLGVTRFFLKRWARGGYGVLILILDFALSIAVFLAVSRGVGFIGQTLQASVEGADFLERLSASLRQIAPDSPVTISDPAADVAAVFDRLEAGATLDLAETTVLTLAVLAAACLVTSLTTSVWLWLALIFSPLFRAVAWSRSRGATLVGRIFDVDRAPIAALGYLTAAMILVAGALVWGADQAIAALDPPRAVAPASQPG